MYAVIASGGKQYRVAVGQVIKLEKLQEAAGDVVDFNEVLMVVDGEKRTVGQPTVEGAKVKAVVVDQSRAKKVKILKFKRRKHHMKRMGHRQHITTVKIETIEQ